MTANGGQHGFAGRIHLSYEERSTIALALALQAATGLDAVEVAVEILLQKH